MSQKYKNVGNSLNFMGCFEDENNYNKSNQSKPIPFSGFVFIHILPKMHLEKGR